MTTDAKDYRCLRKVFFALLMACIFAVIWKLDVLPIITLGRDLDWEHIKSSLRNKSETLQKYKDMQSAYKRRLASLPRQKYRPAKMFKDFGEPVYKMPPSNSTEARKILMWTGFFGDTNFIPKNVSIGKKKYCVGTHNRADLLSSDLVIMHARDMQEGVKDLPAERRPFQRWAYFVLESPYNIWLDLKQFQGIFNWTLTYRSDSDISVPYFQVVKRTMPLTPANYRELYASIYRSKSKLVSYVNSNCHTLHSARMDYIKELSQYIPVDTYGGCFKMKCPRDSEECTKTLTEYKFYLAMENSNCRDYITEKVGQPLFVWHAVPVVMGGGDPSDYERRLPPGSYIHTSGFESAKDLAYFLLVLDQNPALYEKYHQWRRTHDGANNIWAAFTSVCRALHEGDREPSQTYRDFSGWYAEDTCKL